MARVPVKADSVYDFLYADLPRIQVFNSQFSQYGHLTDLTRSTSVSNSVGGGIDLKLVKADTSESDKTELQSRYDARLVAPLTFLDNAKDMIVRDITKAAVGQFVLVSGALQFFDLGLLKAAWGLRSIQKLIRAGAAKGAKGRGAAAPNETMDLLLELLPILPHGFQAKIENPSVSVWCSLREDGIVGSSIDIALKHGSNIPGEWNMVGILDALSEGGPPPSISRPDMGQVINSGESTMAAEMALSMQPLVRQLLGRPGTSFGVTPLLIMREVT